MDFEQKHAGSRRRIVDAAILEFSQHGFAGARVDRIAQQSGINKAMLYYHFNSKENLYNHVIHANIDRVVGDFLKFIADGHDLYSLLLALARHYIRIFTPDNPFSAILLREMASDPSRIMKAMEAVAPRRGLPERLLELINREIEQGTIRPIDPRQMMISFIGMNIFYLLFAPMIENIWKIDNPREFRDKRPDVVVDLFFNGIAVHDGGSAT